MTRIAFWDVSGGHGTPTLVYHLAHMFADQGRRTLLLDFDPTSRLTAMCVSEERLVELWQHGSDKTIAGFIDGLLTATKDLPQPKLEELRPGLDLLPGDLSFAIFEGAFARAWASGEDPESIAVLSALDR
ncbi:MAG TPA: AAA family ATPase, partial [Nannocystis sp.]